MRGTRLFVVMRAAAILVFTMIVMNALAAPREKVPSSLAPTGENGFSSYAGLVFDGAGNLYGTTALGGGPCPQNSQGCGTVFELTPKAGGGWTERVLLRFNPNGKGGFSPYAGLVLDSDGNLYGTTVAGGDLTTCNGLGCGTVFELTPNEGGSWTETVLHKFHGTDGWYPDASMIFDAAGNLYGTTGGGGIHDSGTVFELMPKSGGGWTEKVLHSFDGKDGGDPNGLIFDSSGNLYGTCGEGGHGMYPGGTIFELTPTTDGDWKENLLYSFRMRDGYPYNPIGGVILDASGNLYGTTSEGGALHIGAGTVFELIPPTGGGVLQVLHDFGVQSNDGVEPVAGLIPDSAGNLYGTTRGGGESNSGTAFGLAPTTGGGWTEKVLHSFNGSDGGTIQAGLIFDADGNLYGTTAEGGAHSGGTVFELTPKAAWPWTIKVLYSFNPN
jgi:uncharacterized repeat protein (TIGR03803 family)